MRDSIFGAYLEPPPVRGIQPKAATKPTVSKDGASSMALSKARLEQEAKEREAKLVRTSPSIFKKDPDAKFEFDYYFDDLKMLDDVSYGQRNYYRNLEVLFDKMMKDWENRKKK